MGGKSVILKKINDIKNYLDTMHNFADYNKSNIESVHVETCVHSLIIYPVTLFNFMSLTVSFLTRDIRYEKY